MTKKFYHSNGKLLLTGEYLVLNGAEALVLPLKPGQSLSVQISNTNYENVISWKAFQDEKVWFEVQLNKPDLSLIEFSDHKKAIWLKQLFLVIRTLRPDLFDVKGCMEFETFLDFERNWGFGSSSTLINNLAEWANIDPYKLFKQVSAGSGYDIAAGKIDFPFIYSVREANIKITPVEFNPVFSDRMFFAYSGLKQDTENEVNNYLFNFKPEKNIVNKISELTREISRCNNYNEFAELILLHEKLLAICFDEASGNIIYRYPDLFSSRSCNAITTPATISLINSLDKFFISPSLTSGTAILTSFPRSLERAVAACPAPIFPSSLRMSSSISLRFSKSIINIISYKRRNIKNRYHTPIS